jgi:hypothetical protein
MPDPSDDIPPDLRDGNREGPTYTRGSSFRARAEALARRFRADELRVGWEEHGHLLDPQAAEAGANFLHPTVLDAVKARTAQGKGIHAQRTLENMLSSQALCFNVFAPLASEPYGLELARDVLAPHVPGLARVRSIAVEYTPPFEVFHDQSGNAGVDCDALLEFETDDGETGVLVVETKFVEEAFSPCAHRKKNQCPTDVLIGRDFLGCRYVSRSHYRYWDRGAEAGSLKLSFVEQRGCPFAGPLWQVWVNHTLAFAEAKRRSATRAVFAVCAPEANDSLNARVLLEEYRAHVADPSTVVFVALESLLERLEHASLPHPTLTSWAAALRRRYTVPASEVARAARPVASPRQALSDGHRRITAWMATDDFRELVARHEAALGDRATIYFRPTDRGLVRIALHPSAPGYVGFRRGENDNGYLVLPERRAQTVEELRTHFEEFEVWLQTVRRSSNEERGVISWLRLALQRNLWLPELGEAWAFLHQEWRFADAAGRGKKTDVLAVHLPTGRLGIVEFKSSDSERASAQKQVEAYAAFWKRDAEELAPWFTDLIRALGRAYGNYEAAVATVTRQPAALYVGTASPGAPLRIQPHVPLTAARRA